jgi:gluconate kinase
VLDVGAFHRETRDVVRTWASENKQPLTLHYLSFSRDVRLERLRQRNERRGNNYSFNVPQWVFDLIEQIFEPPTDEEKPMIVYR